MEARGVWRIAGERRKSTPSAERTVVLWGALSLFLIGWATVAVTNVAETLFLKRVGVERLPIVFLVNSLLLALSTLAVGRLAARGDRGRLLTRTLLLLGLAVLLLWAATGAGMPGAMAALVVSAKQIQAVGLLVFWVALGGWLDGRQAKRLYPPIMAGGTVGTLAGSFASAPLASAIGIPALLIFGAASLVLAAGASRQLRRAVPARLEAPRPRTRRARRPPPSFASVWRQSGLFRLLAISTFLGGLLAPVLYYQFSAVADAATRGADGEQRLLELFGQLRGWLNVGVLALQVAGTSWLFQRIGVPLASLTAPVVYLVALVALGNEATLAVGVMAMVAATLQDHSLQEPAERTLATLFSERIRPTVAGLIEGPVKRAGGVAGNLLVLAALGFGGAEVVPWTAVPLALVWVGVVWGLWRIYPSLLLESARARRRGQEWPVAELLDARTLRELETALTGDDAQACRSACALLREVAGDRAAVAVAGALGAAPSAHRPLLLTTLDQILEQQPLSADAGTRVRASLAQSIARPDGLDDVQRALLVQIYTRAGRADDRRGIELLERCRQDASPPVRLAAEIALADDHAEGLLADAVRDPDDRVRRVARNELRSALLMPAQNGSRNGDGEASWQRRLGLVANLLESPDDGAAAAATLADVAARYGLRALPAAPAFLAQRGTDDPAVRAALLRFVGHTGLVEEARWAVSRLGARSADEVSAAAESLRRLAPECMEVILEAARSGTRRQRAALAPILREVPVAEGTLAGLIAAELDNARRARDLARALSTGPISSLVLQRLRERVDESAAAVLSLLAARLADPRLAELASLLERVSDDRERAVLIEAMEALLPPDKRAPLLAVLDEREPESRGNGHAPVALDFEEALRRALVDDDELTRTFLAETLEPARRTQVVGAASSAGRLATPPVSSEDPPTNGEGAMLNPVEIVLHLRSLALFDRLRTRQLSELATIVREETHPPGSTIVREGDYADCMYLIVAGTLHVSREGLRLAELGPRDFFGEMAVLDGELRSATVHAITQVDLLRIDRADLLGVMDEHPGIAITICQALSRRVRNLNDEVRELRRKRLA